jgi:hypothetical protein
VKLEDHLVEEDGFEQVERSVVVDELMREGDGYVVLDSCPRRPAYWIQPYSSSVASSPLD